MVFCKYIYRVEAGMIVCSGSDRFGLAADGSVPFFCIECEYAIISINSVSDLQMIAESFANQVDNHKHRRQVG